jgi:benzoyl-CoA reductase/2-hydroxyglutaryl-CoA dehydratase subunit BcrC/BadD/HgdB
MEKDIYVRFLELTGFEPNEIPKFISDFRRACEIFDLTDDDVRFGVEEWIPSQFDIALKGVRMSLGCLVREAVDLSRAPEYKKKGYRMVYGILPAMSVYYYALKLTAPDKVYVAFPDLFIVCFLQMFFHKLNPVLEEAEKAGISYGCRHCALNKARYTARRLNIIPSPDVSWIWGFVCDEGPKTDEFISEYFDKDWKTYITRMPHDQPLGAVEDEIDERVAYLASQMRDGFEFVQKEVGIRVPDGKITEAFNLRMKFVERMAVLRDMISADPQPYGGNELFILGMPRDMPYNTGLDPMSRAMDVAIEDVKQRVSRKEGVLPEGAPVLMYEIIPYPQPWIVNLFAQNGVGVMPGGPTEKQLLPPRFEDPYMAAAEAWLKSSVTVNAGYKADQICERLLKYKFDGLLLGFFDFDRWLGSDNKMLARMVEEKTNLPVFYIEGDFWEDRDYSKEALKNRIESICEIIKMRKAG